MCLRRSLQLVKKLDAVNVNLTQFGREATCSVMTPNQETGSLGDLGEFFPPGGGGGGRGGRQGGGGGRHRLFLIFGRERLLQRFFSSAADLSFFYFVLI